MATGEQVFTNCTTGGPVNAYVKDGKITRIEPIEFTPDDGGKWVIKARDKSFSPPDVARVAQYTLTERARIYAKNRILYPMLREDFDPNGERNPQNRGKSGYKRISWDQALDIACSEIKRIKDAYGPGGILAESSSHHNWGNVGYRISAFCRFLAILNVTFAEHNTDSWEGFHWGAMHSWGFPWRLGFPEQYDMLEEGLKNAEMIVFWSADPEGQPLVYNGQETTPWRFWLKELGVKMVFIDPYFNSTAVNHNEKWLAPRPGTDSALACAIAYVWITEDTYDKEYVATRTHGFDKWRDYVLGKEDGVPKTPEWAAEESGIPAREIKALAREWHKKKTFAAAGGFAGGASRAAYATEWARMIGYLLAMQGLGKPGRGLWSTSHGAPYNYGVWFPGYSEGAIFGDGNNCAAPAAMIQRGYMEHPVGWIHNGPGGQHVPRLRIPEALNHEDMEWRGKGFCGNALETQFRKYKYPEDGYSKVRMYYRYGGSFIGTMTETNRYVRAYQSPHLEFALNQSVYMEGEAPFADLILPACSNFERWDIGEWANCSGYVPHSNLGCNRRVVVLQKPAIEPLGESKSDYDIFCMLAKRLDFWGKFTEGRSLFDWTKRMFEYSDLPKLISWEEFEKKGYFCIPVPEDYKPHPAFRWFAENRKRDTPDAGFNGGGVEGLPDGHGHLGTHTGLIEFESESLKRFDPNDNERPPVAHYIPSWEGHHTTELTAKYPLQIITPHPRYSFHTMYDGKDSWMNEIPEHRALHKDGYRYWVIRINPVDAKARGIKQGDLVKAFNDRGAVILSTIVTNRVPPGVAHSYESCAVYDPIGDPGVSPDRGGCVNILTPKRFISKNACGMAPNSCLIEIEKWEA